MKLHSEVDIDIDTLLEAQFVHNPVNKSAALYDIWNAVINGLDPEGKKIFESYTPVRRKNDKDSQ